MVAHPGWNRKWPRQGSCLCFDDVGLRAALRITCRCMHVWCLFNGPAEEGRGNSGFPGGAPWMTRWEITVVLDAMSCSRKRMQVFSSEVSKNQLPAQQRSTIETLKPHPRSMSPAGASKTEIPWPSAIQMFFTAELRRSFRNARRSSTLRRRRSPFPFTLANQAKPPGLHSH